MISALTGTLEVKGADFVVLNVGGVSFKVHTSAFTLKGLGASGEKIRLHTYLQVKEESLALYGFATPQELALFRMLMGVRGVGPKIALALLSALKPDELALALASGNADLLSQVPGVGKKTASRLLLELQGKMEREGMGPSPVLAGRADIISALTRLGYTAAEAASAVAALPDSPDLTLEERVRLALKHLGGG